MRGFGGGGVVVIVGRNVAMAETQHSHNGVLRSGVYCGNWFGLGGLGDEGRGG